MKIHHAALYVHDLEGAKTFFETYFKGKAGEQYHNVKTGFRSYFLTFEEGSRLELMYEPDLDGRSGTKKQYGYAHLAFSAKSKAAVDALTQRLAEDGYQVISGPRTTGDGYYESCVCGFEGNLVEITV